jgi:hypothetical protein
MKNLYKIFSLLLLLTVLFFNSCRNPAYDMNVLFDADIIKYKATIILKDASGTALPANLSVSVTGTDAASIYDFSGTKVIYAPGGVITLGVTPKGEPTAAKALSFNIIVKGSGYEDKNIPVAIIENQFSQIIEVTMLKSNTPTSVTSVISRNVPLSPTGAVTATTTLVTPVSATVPQTTTVTLPAGTQLKDGSGAILTGSAVNARAINFDASDPEAIGLFPGGDFSAPVVTGPGGTKGPAFFIPAGYTSIQLFVGTTEVKSFTNPISVKVQLDPAFRPQATGALLKAGDQLSIYSYQVETGEFKYESMGTVAQDGSGQLAITFETSHLTIFIIGDVIPTPGCKGAEVTFIAPWLGVGTQPLQVEIYTSDGLKLLDKRTLLMKDGLKDYFTGLPAIPVRYRIVDNVNKALAEGSITDPCAGTAFTINLGVPEGGAPQSVTLVLNVVCPDKGAITVPNFDLFYKPAGAPNSAYALLGTAEKGLLKTTLLKVGSSYDFRATWRNTTKTASRLITDQDMSATVDPNGFLGSPGSENYNRGLLIEACKGL